MESEKFVKKKGYMSYIEGLNWRVRVLGRWSDEVKEYMSERGICRGA